MIIASRIDGTAGPECAGGRRVLYAPTWLAAVEWCEEIDAAALVLVRYPLRAVIGHVTEARRRLTDVPIVVMMARAPSGYEEGVLIEAGADAVARYPLPLRSWTALIEGLVRRRRQGNQAPAPPAPLR